MKRWFLALSLLLVAALGAAPRRRAVLPADQSLPALWLWTNAHALHATNYPAPDADLQPLRSIVGDAEIVGLGDATHGSHEFYAIKLRIIDFLVREMGFDVVAFEAAFPLFDRLNDYVRNGVGDPRAILADANERLYYTFWDVEEMLAVVEWMRGYNIDRGGAAVEIAGVDPYDAEGAVAAVMKYLQSVDGNLADMGRTEYACVEEFRPTHPCRLAAARMRETLTERRAELERLSTPRAFEDALQNARIIEQSQMAFGDRDPNMAENAKWLLEHRSTSRRIIYWAHQEHVGKTPSPWAAGGLPAGWFLARDLGARYVVIGSLTGGGTVRHWNTADRTPFVSTIPALAAGSYETYFRLRPAVALLIPLRGALPAWLTGPAPYYSTGKGPSPEDRKLFGSLPAKMDAVIYIDQTSPTTPLQ